MSLASLYTRTCLRCGGKMIPVEIDESESNSVKYVYRCTRCGFEFTHKVPKPTMRQYEKIWRALAFKN